MVNCNPETVSTDYDTVDRLYFEPLTFEDVSAIIAREQEAGGDVAVRRPIRRADAAEAGAAAAATPGVKILGTSPDSIDLAEDRERFAKLLWDLGIPQAPSGTATSPRRSARGAATIGFPLVVRPSYVLGGRAMAIVYDMAALDRYMTHAVQASPEHPILIDKFLEDAVELDVDAVADAAAPSSSAASWSTSRRPASTRATAPASCPPYKVAERHVATDSRLHAPDRARAEGRRPDERAVRDQGRHRVRARSESARVADGAVPVEGDRRAAREGRGARDDRQARSRSSGSPRISTSPAYS